MNSMVILPFMVVVHHVDMCPVEIFYSLSCKLRSGMTNQSTINTSNFCNVLGYETDIVGYDNDSYFFI